MAVTDYSTTPGSNTTISGINIAEGCPPANINNAQRQMMADIRVMYNNLPSTAGFMPTSAGTFTGTAPKYTSEGAFMHLANSSFTSGRVYILAEGSADPAGLAAGDLIFYYTP